MVTVTSNADLGMLSVTVKADTDREAGSIMQAIAETLVKKNIEFRGGDEKSAEVRILSGPISEKNPSPKELIAIILVAFAAGAALMSLRVAWRTYTREF